MYKLKPLELSLVFGILVALVWGAGTANAQASLAECLIRLHIIAHSDTPEDQENKLAVRDAVLETVRSLSGQADTLDDMEELLYANLSELEEIGEQTLRERGCFQQVSATLTNCYFPTKDYRDFALPAGTYKALRLTIGDGAGENWWCVAFPPLCVGASSQSIGEAAQAGFFTKEQADFLTGEAGNYVLKFKTMELVGEVKRLFRID